MMKLIIGKQSEQLDNSQLDINELFEMLEGVLLKEGLFFSHFIIDGKEVHSDYEVFIQENISTINDIEVITYTVNEFIGELLVSLNEYTERAIPEIELMVEEFYQGPKENTWAALHQLLEGLEWIYETIKSIDKTKHNISNWNDFIAVAATFEIELPNLLEAIENKDNILTADIVQYEILPQFQEIQAKTNHNFEVK